LLKTIASEAARTRGGAATGRAARLWVRFPYFALATVLATYGLIILGGVVRVTDSGLGCPDWPRCHGQLIPPFERAALIEYSHRLVAMTVGFMVLGTAIGAWKWYRDRPAVLLPANLALLLLAVQVLLGGATVNSELDGELVTAHLGVALALLGSLIVVAMQSFSGKTSLRGLKGFPALIVVAALAAYAVILSGAYVRGSGAGLAFSDWPLFNGKLIAEGGRLAQIHFAHRVAAGAVGIIIVLAAVKAWRFEARPGVVALAGAATLALYAGQVLVGAANVWTELKPVLAVAHLALASALWSALVVMAAGAYFVRDQTPAPAPAGAS